MLELTGVHAGYGAVRALLGLDLRVEEGSVVALLGRNGAGKTTTLRAASAMIRPTAGRVSFEGASIAGLSTEQLVARGLVHVPEGRALFPGMSVAENLELGAHVRHLSRRVARVAMREVLDDMPTLAGKLGQAAGSLSGGEQQLLVLGRALMARPRMLLLDEPSFGLSPVACAELYYRLAGLRATGMTVLVVEQYVDLVTTIADRVYVIDKGRTVTEGSAQDVLAGDVLQRTYLAETMEALP